jgi:hypothetical protein
VCWNFKTFQNTCFAQCEGYKKGDRIEADECPPLPPVAAGDCSKCSTTFKSPVCFKGKTYDNSCFAQCDGFKAGESTMASGTCSAASVDAVAAAAARPVAAKPDNCRCPVTYAPVCWNRMTYTNLCYAQCAGARPSELSVVRQGRCDNNPFISTGVPVSAERCFCDSMYDPVCWNGKTYANFCFTRCDGAKATDVNRTARGFCPSESADPPMVPWVFGTTGGCDCPSTVAPVCFKGKSHRNSCLALCKTKGAVVTSMTAGPCTAVRTGRCKCFMYLDPVCYKGKSYTNACLAACDGAANFEIKSGECPSAPWSLSSVGEDTDQCGRILNPVCFRGKSFDNRCGAFLYGALDGDYTMAPEPPKKC